MGEFGKALVPIAVYVAGVVTGVALHRQFLKWAIRHWQ